jgi:hypothetical protein
MKGIYKGLLKVTPQDADVQACLDGHMLRFGPTDKFR